MASNLEISQSARLNAYQRTIKRVNSAPLADRYSPPRSMLGRWQERRNIFNPLIETMSPEEQRYVRAHSERAKLHKEASVVADLAVRATLPPYPDAEEERLWSAQSSWGINNRDALRTGVDQQLATSYPPLVRERTGFWLGDPQELLLREHSQPELYARVGALALADAVGDRRFHEFDMSGILRDGGLLTGDATAVRDRWLHDDVLRRVGAHSFQLNPHAAEHLGSQPVYDPPTVH